jgi:hypothetical protein
LQENEQQDQTQKKTKITNSSCQLSFCIHTLLLLFRVSTSSIVTCESPQCLPVFNVFWEKLCASGERKGNNYFYNFILKICVPAVLKGWKYCSRGGCRGSGSRGSGSLHFSLSEHSLCIPYTHFWNLISRMLFWGG